MGEGVAIGAIALVSRNPLMATRADHDRWILEHLMRPIRLQSLLQDETYNVLDISLKSSTFYWAQQESNLDTDGDEVDVGSPQIQPLRTLSDQHASKKTRAEKTSESPGLDLPGHVVIPLDTIVRITPDTRIYNLSEQFRVVFVVDVSASMRTVDLSEGKARVLVSYVFEVFIQPEIYTTVLAEAGVGVFGPEQNPRAAAFCENHPIYTLIQNVQVTSSNLFALAEQIADALNDYENTLIQHRQADTKEFLERGESEVGLMGPQLSDIPVKGRPELGLPFASTSSLISHQGKPSPPDQPILNSLDYALFALRLLPLNTTPVVIYLTDGVSVGMRGGDFVYRDACRRLAKENVNFTVIQAGSSDGFVPRVNFGYVPDNEALRFLAIATFGNFIYGSDCKYLDVETVIAPGTSESLNETPPSPNFYHLNLLFRMTVLTKLERENKFRAVNAGLRERNVDLPRSKLINAEMDTSTTVTAEEKRFPWTLESRPPLVAEILCGYKDYHANARLDFLINARLLEGFSLRSIHITKKSNRKGDKVEIILARHWLPNVTIQYTIKTVWSDTGLPLLYGDSASSAGKPPRVELNILAHHAFAIQFVNVQDAEVKPDRLMKLHNYLRGIYEMDELLKMVASFNTDAVLGAVPKADPKLFPSVTPAGPGNMPMMVPGEQNTGIWHVLCHIVATKSSFDEWDKDIILRPTSSQKVNILSLALPHFQMSTSSSSLSSTASRSTQERLRLPTAFYHLTQYFATVWSTFALSRQTFVKYLGVPSSGASSGASSIPSGFVVLRFVFETDWLVSLKFSFLNATKQQRIEVVEDICSHLADIRLGITKRVNPRGLEASSVSFAPIVVCKRPARRLLIRYQFPAVEDDDSSVDSHSRVTGETLQTSPESNRDYTFQTRGDRSCSSAMLISRPPVKSYLRSHRWVWLADVPIKETEMDRATVLPPHELAFEILCRLRLEEGYLLVSHKPFSVTFYREVLIKRQLRVSGRSSRVIRLLETPTAPQRDIRCAVQFVAMIDHIRQTVVTELWAEPICDGPMDPTLEKNESRDIRVLFSELHDETADDIETKDRKLFERIYTFDRVYTLGTEFRQGVEVGEIGRGRIRARTRDDALFLSEPRQIIGPPSDLQRPQPKPLHDIGRMTSIVPTEYRLASLLLDSLFSVSVFHVPFVSLAPALDLYDNTPEDTPPNNMSPEVPVVTGQFQRGSSFSIEHNSLSRSRTNSPTVNLDSPGSPYSFDVPAPGRENRSLSNSGLGPSATSRDTRSLSNSGIGQRRSLNDLSINIPQPPDSEGGNLNLPTVKLPGDPIINAPSIRERIGLALHRFLERAVASVTDGEIPIGPVELGPSAKPAKTASDVLQVDALSVSPISPGFIPKSGRKISRKVGPYRMDLLERIRDSVREKMEYGSDILVSDIKHSVCFVKIISEQRFLLIFLPLYPATPKNLQRRTGKESTENTYGMEMSEEDRLRIRYLTLTIVDSHRPFARTTNDPLQALAFESTSMDGILEVKIDYNYLVKPNFGGIGQEIQDGTVILRGKAGRPHARGDDDSEYEQRSKSSRFDSEVIVRDFMSAVANAYSAALCRTIFFTLSQGLQMESIDLDRALSSCVETKVCFDLTGYLNVQTLKSRMNGRGSSRYRLDAIEIQKRFKNVLSQWFQPVSKLLNEERNVYFFKPTSKRRQSKNSKVKERTVELLRLLDVSETPLLLRVECSFRKASMRSEESTSVPVYTLPVSYYISGQAPYLDSDSDSVNDEASDVSFENDPSALDFTPHIIGTDFSPIESVDGTIATLHLICLSLPLSDAIAKVDTVDNNSKEAIEKTFGARALTSPDKLKALCETSASISSLLQDEIMDGLLQIAKVDDEASSRLVWKILRERHDADLQSFNSGLFENTITTDSLSIGMSLKTFFLGSSNTGFEILKQEFMKANFTNRDLQVIQMPDMFRVLSPLLKVDDGAGEYTNMADGLGITMSSSAQSPPFFGVESLIKSPFWLLASFERGRCNILYFSKRASPVERATILRAVRKYVAECCEKVNRLMLLRQLNETHKASKYLISPATIEKDTQMQDGSSEDEENSGPSSYESTDSYMKPLNHGCFACPLVYKRSFPLHWRLRPAQVLNSIVMTINPLLITNRKNMFVFATRDSVYYFHISITEILDDLDKGERDGQKDDTKRDTMSAIVGMKESPKTPGSPGSRRAISATTSATPTLSSSRQTDHALTLDFFGAESPGKEVVLDFMSHIEMKLNALTQTALSTYLSRSVAVKLTHADVDFILPIARAPQTPPIRREWLKIPESVQNPYLLVLLLRQYILSFLSPLGGTDVASALKRYYGTQFGFSEVSTLAFDHNERSANILEFTLGDFSFLYNGVSSRNQSLLESSVGSGIASICLAVIDSSGKVVLEAPKFALFDFNDCYKSLKQDLDIVSENWDSLRLSDFSLEPAARKGFKILVEIWSVSTLNLDVIFEKVVRGMNETLYDYMVETCIRRYALELSDGMAESHDDAPQTSSLNNDGVAAKSVAGSKIDSSFASFIGELTTILKASSSLNHIAVQELSSPVKLPHWIIEEFAAEIQDMFNEISFLPAPLIAKKDSNLVNLYNSSDPAFEIFRPSRNVGDKRTAPAHSSRSDDEYVVVIGFREFSNKYTNSKHGKGGKELERKQSFDSDSSGFSTPPFMLSSTMGPSRWNSIEDSPQDQPGAAGNKKASKRITPLDLGPTGWTRSAMEEVMHYTGYFHSSALELGPRSCFLVMLINNANVSVFTYNWHRNHCEHIFGEVLRSLSWNNIRLQFLDRQSSSHSRTPNIDYSVPEVGSYNSGLTHAPGISYSSSYGGVQGLGFASLQQFAERQRPALQDVDSISSGTDAFKKIFNMDADILQRHAVEYLDRFVRHVRLPVARTLNVTIEGATVSKLQAKPKAISVRKWEDISILAPAHSHDTFEKSEDRNVERLFTIAELADILRSVRLYFARCLLLFSELRSSYLPRTGFEREDHEVAQADTDLSKEGKEATKEEIVFWHKHMVEGFLSDYIAYLVSLGMEVVAYFKPESLRDDTGTQIAGLGILSNSNIAGISGTETGLQVGIGGTPSYSINSNTSIDVGIIYLKKAVHSGIMIIQLSVDHVFISVNMYTLKFPDPETSHDTASELKTPADKESEKEFKTDCINLRNVIHINSFSYDFHMRYIQNILEGKTIPSHHFNTLDIIDSFYKYTNSRQPGFARSRLLHGECTSSLANLSRSLFKYIVESPTKYGYKTVFHNGEPSACFVSSKFPDFCDTSSESQFEEGPYSYAVLIYSREKPTVDEATPLSTTFVGKRVPTTRVIPPPPLKESSISPTSSVLAQRLNSRQAESRLSLRFYVLVLQNDTVFPLESSSPGLSDPRNDDIRQEYHASGCYLGDIVKFAERKIEKLVDQAIRHYGRDSLWRQILKPDDPEGPSKMDKKEAFQWTRLFLEKIGTTSRSVVAIDQDLVPFFTGHPLPWLQIFAFLKRRFTELTRELSDYPVSGVRHLLIFNPKNSDYLLHLSVWVAGESGLPDVVTAESGHGSELPPLSASISGSHARDWLSDMQRLSDRLMDMERLGVTRAKPGDLQIDMMAVSREGVADEVEYGHINDVISAISFWLWENSYSSHHM
ncbi:hypothetical protein HDU97_002036 [Phlyctochytrium planicorne]|nr:hypothetical protein HDU97_002036 [Phlyctochytrium planicorne]